MADEQQELPMDLPPIAPASPPAKEPDWRRLILRAAKYFRPTSPITVPDVFAGRERQLTRVCDVVTQEGQHALLYGERGVGKTSLASVLSAYLVASEEDGEYAEIVSPRVNCDADDTFDSVWRKVLKVVRLTEQHQPAGFDTRPSALQVDATVFLEPEYMEEPNPKLIDVEAVRVALTLLGERAIPILIIDEFDRLVPPVRRVFADLIKTLSDHTTPATIVLVGVADSVDGLLEDHQSIARALVQVNVPRMTASEIRAILVKGSKPLGMSFDEDAVRWITAISQGLPHYAHLLGLNAVRAALRKTSLRVTTEHVEAAIRQAAQDTQQSVQKAYVEAIRSAKPGNLFADVLLACAIADKDELGHFKAQDVRRPMQMITGRDYDIPNFAQHLSEFCSEKRGRILWASGEKRRRTYQFRDPLMQPFVIMHGALDHKLPKEFFDGSALEVRV